MSSSTAIIVVLSVLIVVVGFLYYKKATAVIPACPTCPACATCPPQITCPACPTCPVCPPQPELKCFDLPSQNINYQQKAMDLLLAFIVVLGKLNANIQIVSERENALVFASLFYTVLRNCFILKYGAGSLKDLFNKGYTDFNQQIRDKLNELGFKFNDNQPPIYYLNYFKSSGTILGERGVALDIMLSMAN